MLGRVQAEPACRRIGRWSRSPRALNESDRHDKRLTASISVTEGQMVRLALDSLSERQRVALLLTKFENMSYQDVADTMGLSVQAVKSLLFRARLNLKAMLEPYVEQGRRPHAAPPDDAD